MTRHMLQFVRHTERELVAEVEAYWIVLGCLIALLTLPFAILAKILLLVPVILLTLTPKRFLARLPVDTAPVTRLFWYGTNLPLFGGNMVTIRQGNEKAARLKIRYGIFSGQKARDLRVKWHPELPVLAMRVLDDIYHDTVFLDLRDNRATGATIGLENLYEWSGTRFFVRGFSKDCPSAPVPEDEPLLEWARTALPRVEAPRKNEHE